MRGVGRFVRALAVTAGVVAPLVAQGPARVRVVLPAFTQPIAMDTIISLTEFEAPAGRVWSAAARVFYDYKIPTDVRDSARGVVGTVAYTKSSYFQDFMMSAVLNCGMSITGPNADNFRITSALVAIVFPGEAGKTRLGVGFVGSGVDMRGHASDPVICASTGRVESDVANRVRVLLSKP